MSQGTVHTKQDKRVSWDEVRGIQREVTGHLKALNKVFQTGTKHGKDATTRTCHAKELISTAIPILTLLAKDHKPTNEQGDPKTRPVCGACKSVNGELSEWVSMILDSACQSEPTDESIGTEDMLHEVDKLVEYLRREEIDASELMVLSLDAEALYPSLDVEDVARACAKQVVQSSLEIEGVNWNRGGKVVFLPHKLFSGNIFFQSKFYTSDLFYLKRRKPYVKGIF